MSIVSVSVTAFVNDVALSTATALEQMICTVGEVHVGMPSNEMLMKGRGGRKRVALTLLPAA